VRQRGKEAYKQKLTNKNYKDYNGLESGKQVVGPISAQTLVGWRFGECGDKLIGVVLLGPYCDVSMEPPHLK
jgi:hypothetical protein